MESVVITPMYAALLGIVLLVLSIRVVAVVRVKGGKLYGDGGDPALVTVVRGQANFTEYVPLIVILIAFAEAGGTSATWLHVLGGGLLVGRILHPIGLTTHEGINAFRFIGTNLTWLALLGAAVCVLLNVLG